MSRQIKHRVPNLGVVILLTFSIGMGLQATQVSHHQLLDVNPTLYCGMQVSCHE